MSAPSTSQTLKESLPEGGKRGGGSCDVDRSEQTESQIIESVLKGCSGNFEVLVRQHQLPVYCYLFRMTKNQETAEELTQEAFVRAWQKLDQWRGDSPFRGWLILIARNLALSHFRKQKSGGAGSEISMDDDSVPLSSILQDHKPDALQVADRKQKQEILNEAISLLSQQQREIVHLYYHEEMSLAKIAEIMDKKSGAAKVALHRARVELKKIVHQLTAEKLS